MLWVVTNLTYWYKVHEPKDSKGLFKLGNCIWLCYGALLQQGKLNELKMGSILLSPSNMLMTLNRWKHVAWCWLRKTPCLFLVVLHCRCLYHVLWKLGGFPHISWNWAHNFEHWAHDVRYWSSWGCHLGSAQWEVREQNQSKDQQYIP